MMRQPEGSPRLQILVQAAIVSAAAILLFWNLTAKDLWQDEAATAVLAVRMLKFGRPLAYDGVNLITIDINDKDEDAANGRTAAPQPAIDAVGEGGGIRYSDVQYAIGFEDAAGFAKGGVECGEVLQAVVADNEIEGSGRKWQTGSVRQHVRAAA